MMLRFAVRTILPALMLLAIVLIGGARPAMAQAEVARSVPVCLAPLARAADERAAFAGVGFSCATTQARLGPGNYWALSPPLHGLRANERLHVRVASLWQDRLTLYARYADGTVLRVSADGREASRRMTLGGLIDFALPARAAPLDRLLWRIDGSANVRGVLLGQHLLSPERNGALTAGMIALYVGFAGVAVALLFYNLALWAALRYRFQLAYCAMVAMLLVYVFASSGALAWAFPDIANNDRIRIGNLALGLSVALIVAFARSFFERRVFDGWVGATTTAGIALIGGSGVAFATLTFIDVAFADRLTSLMYLTGLVAALPIVVQTWRRGGRFLWIFALFWAAPLLLGATRTLTKILMLPEGFWMANSGLWSIGFEVLLGSLAITYRVHMLGRERDAALANEVLARKLADADPLTGLSNRRAFLADAIGRAGPQTLTVVDIDHFKAINETLGHDGGDEVLRVFARELRRLTPPGGVVARMGGEEFAILADAALAIDPQRLVDRLRAVRMPFDLTVTSSAGCCTGPLASDVDWKHLYRNADKALFEAKAAGRDRGRTAPPLAAAA